MCGVTVVASYLKAHTAMIHGIYVPHKRGVNEVGVGTTTYIVSFPKVLKKVRFPVPGFPYMAHRAVRLREHFMFCHFRSKVAVVQEGKKPLPHCDLFCMHMPAGRLNRHRKTVRCNRNT